MADLIPIIKSRLNEDSFEEIYKVIKPDLKANSNKNELHFDLADILCFVPQDVHEKEHSPTHGEIIKFLNRFKSDIERLTETLAYAEKLYPSLINEERGSSHSQIPEWLSLYVDHFKRDELQGLVKGLSDLHEDAQNHSNPGKKPRYSGRYYYIEKLISVFEKHTTLKAKAKRDDSTPFGRFAVAYFFYAPVDIQDKEKITEFVIFEELNKLKLKGSK